MLLSIKDQFTSHIRVLQKEICTALEDSDGQARFVTDEWDRPGGGGGVSCIISNGNIFEKGGVNVSVVHGKLPPMAAQKLKIAGELFFACGLSLVIHPLNPFVPTVHANWRYFEVYSDGGDVLDAWFGGGTDLTPYYLFEEDAIQFHSVQKKCCDEFDTTLYPTFKAQCDSYFNNHHRDGERRGIGGIFFDHCKGTRERSLTFWKAFVEKNGKDFLKAYLPIVEKRKNTPFTDKHKFWQEIRRGRYVEFNLLHDRGTLFGIKTNGRTESILMSLPPTVRFEYNYQPSPGSEEAR
ncbi:oxygen-dependent coproporphyrinogen oxidase, partial [bacterium]|nr:oxygen-dependent coproporphyrinogen oxidase [bacterium]